VSTLADWSLGRIVLLAAAWVLLCIVGVAASLVLQFRGAYQESGSGGIGAVSFGINALVLFGPPVILMVVWLIARWTRAS
jgi:hypothetical protein